MVTVSNTGVLTPVSVPGYTLSGPGAVAVDSTGNLFVADSNNARVLELKTSGTVVLVGGPPILSYPASLAFDPAGDLYIGDASNLAIYRVSASELESGNPSPALVNIGNVSGLFPGALATDAARAIYTSLTEVPTTFMSCQPGRPWRRTSLPQDLPSVRHLVSASTLPVTGMCWMAETRGL